MKRLWDCRRTFLAFIAIVGLLLDMDKNPLKDYSMEIAGIVGAIGTVNMLQDKNKKVQDVAAAPAT